MSSPQATPHREALHRQSVVLAATALADRAGLDAVSMRKLAAELDVTPMALYNHVANREDLIDAMVDHVITLPAPPADPGPWRAALRQRLLTMRAVMQRHPWAPSAIETRTRATPATLAHMNHLMAIMFAGGLSADLVHHAMHTLSTRMWGFTRDVLPTPEMPTDAGARAALMEMFAATYPSIVYMAINAPGAGDACDSDAEFEFALDVMLDGVENRHARGWTSTE